MGDLLRDAPPPPPSAVTNPSTAPGTLAGRNVQGTVPAPVDTSLPPGQSGLAGSGGAPGMAGQEAVQPVAPKVTADSKVRPDFVEDLAAYLVSRYKPGPRGGSLAVSVQSVNQRYGVKLAGQAEGGRAGLLRYAFHPTMLQSLYALYVDRFMAALDREAAAKALSPEQNREMHMALAGRFVMLAGALEGVASVPDLGKRIKGLEQISQNVVDINSQMTAAVFDLDQLRENRASQPEIATTQLRVDGLSARYRRALEERAAAQRALWWRPSARGAGRPWTTTPCCLWLIGWTGVCGKGRRPWLRCRAPPPCCGIWPGVALRPVPEPPATGTILSRNRLRPSRRPRP